MFPYISCQQALQLSCGPRNGLRTRTKNYRIYLDPGITKKRVCPFYRCALGLVASPLNSGGAGLTHGCLVCKNSLVRLSIPFGCVICNGFTQRGRCVNRTSICTNTICMQQKLKVCPTAISIPSRLLGNGNNLAWDPA